MKKQPHAAKASYSSSFRKVITGFYDFDYTYANADFIINRFILVEIVHCAIFFDDSIISILVLSLGRFFLGVLFLRKVLQR